MIVNVNYLRLSMAKHQTLLEQLHQANESFQKTVSQLVHLAKLKAAEEVAVIENAAHSLIGKNAGRPATLSPTGVSRHVGRPKGSKNKKRVRRDGAQLKALAEKAAATIKAAGKNGISAGDLRRQIKGIDGSVKIFIEKFTNHKVKQEGKLRQTRYRLA
jgi:hypothetical protein